MRLAKGALDVAFLLLADGQSGHRVLPTFLSCLSFSTWNTRSSSGDRTACSEIWQAGCDRTQRKMLLSAFSLIAN